MTLQGRHRATRKWDIAFLWEWIKSFFRLDLTMLDPFSHL
jgi:hypothetical protein